MLHVGGDGEGAGEGSELLLEAPVGNGTRGTHGRPEADLVTLSMESRILRQKILLIFHMARLQEGYRARMMLEEQQKNDWPGLAQEVISMCKWLGLEDAATPGMDRNKYEKTWRKRADSWMKRT